MTRTARIRLPPLSTAYRMASCSRPRRFRGRRQAHRPASYERAAWYLGESFDDRSRTQSSASGALDGARLGRRRTPASAIVRIRCSASSSAVWHLRVRPIPRSNSFRDSSRLGSPSSILSTIDLEFRQCSPRMRATSPRFSTECVSRGSCDSGEATAAPRRWSIRSATAGEDPACRDAESSSACAFRSAGASAPGDVTRSARRRRRARHASTIFERHTSVPESAPQRIPCPSPRVLFVVRRSNS